MLTHIEQHIHDALRARCGQSAEAMMSLRRCRLSANRDVAVISDDLRFNSLSRRQNEDETRALTDTDTV